MEVKRKLCRPGGLKMTDRLIDLAGLSRECALRAADIGCGEGASVAYLRSRCPLWEISGIDPDPAVRTKDMIETGEAEHLPFPDKCMDALLMECSFSKTQDPIQALKEAFRVLKPDGKLLISDMYARKQEYSCEGMLGRLDSCKTIRHRLWQAGFAVLEMADASDTLADLICQWIMDGKGEDLYERLGADRPTLKKAGCGYYLCVAQPSGLWETLTYAGEHSPYYREVWKKKHIENILPGDWETFRSLPFTTPEDVRENPEQFLCVTPKEIARIITLRTSGSQGNPKRLFFTEDDLLRTADFFETGMQYMVKPGDRLTVYMEGPGRFSIGGLLKEGLRRIGVDVTVHGLIHDMELAARDGQGKNCFVGVPSQMYGLARKASELRPDTVLLSADYVPESVKQCLEKTWKCRVFTHWGMTETGYGGGVQCTSREGYHMRDGDLLLEIIDPGTGQPVEEGQYGELVLTTFHRRGMPLIRYRTGDLGRYLMEPCGCGCLKPRLDKVEGRLDDVIRLENGRLLSMHVLDELLLSFGGVNDFEARYLSGSRELTITVDLGKYQENSRDQHHGTDRKNSQDESSLYANGLHVKETKSNLCADGLQVKEAEGNLCANGLQVKEAVKAHLDRYFEGSVSVKVVTGKVNPYIGSGKRKIQIS